MANEDEGWHTSKRNRIGTIAALGVERRHRSARECTNAAIHRIDWRNPAIHRAHEDVVGARSIWSYLEGYFYRSFPYVSPFVAPHRRTVRRGAPASVPLIEGASFQSGVRGFLAGSRGRGEARCPLKVVVLAVCLRCKYKQNGQEQP